MRTSRAGALRHPFLIGCLVAGGACADGGDGLANALQATLRNHPAVAGQRATVSASRFAADTARSQRYPTLSAQAAQYAEKDRSVLDGDDLSHPALLRLRQPIWAFGRIGDSIDAADADVSTQRADLLRVRRQLLEDTAVAYAGVRGSQRRVDIAQGNVQQHDLLFQQIQRRTAGALASDADARLAATRLTQARAQLELALSDAMGATDELLSLTGERASADEPVPEELLARADATDLVADAIDDHAEVQLKERELEQAKAEWQRARTSFMPTIYLQADQYYDQPGLRDDSQISLVFEASLDGLGLAARGRTGAAAASRTAAAQDLAATRLTLRRELEGLQRQRALQARLIELQSQTLDDQQALLQSYQRQYDSGAKSWLDLMNVQRELFEQQRNLVQAQNDWQVYTLMLLAKAGALDEFAGGSGAADD